MRGRLGMVSREGMAMKLHLMDTLAVIGATLQATIVLGFLAALAVVGLTAFGVISAPI